MSNGVTSEHICFIFVRSKLGEYSSKYDFVYFHTLQIVGISVIYMVVKD